MKLLLWHLSEAARKMKQVCGLEQIQETLQSVGMLVIGMQKVSTPTHPVILRSDMHPVTGLTVELKGPELWGFSEQHVNRTIALCFLFYDASRHPVAG